jgi:hypothetical protein
MGEQEDQTIKKDEVCRASVASALPFLTFPILL